MQKSWFEKDKKNDASNGNEDLLVIIIKLLHTIIFSTLVRTGRIYHS